MRVIRRLRVFIATTLVLITCFINCSSVVIAGNVNMIDLGIKDLFQLSNRIYTEGPCVISGKKVSNPSEGKYLLFEFSAAQYKNKDYRVSRFWKCVDGTTCIGREASLWEIVTGRYPVDDPWLTEFESVGTIQVYVTNKNKILVTYKSKKGDTTIIESNDLSCLRYLAKPNEWYLNKSSKYLYKYCSIVIGEDITDKSGHVYVSAKEQDGAALSDSDFVTEKLRELLSKKYTDGGNSTSKSDFQLIDTMLGFYGNYVNDNILDALETDGKLVNEAETGLLGLAYYNITKNKVKAVVDGLVDYSSGISIKYTSGELELKVQNLGTKTVDDELGQLLYDFILKYCNDGFKVYADNHDYYPVLSNVVNAVKSAKDQIENKKSKENKELADNELSNLNPQTPFEKWCYVIDWYKSGIVHDINPPITVVDVPGVDNYDLSDFENTGDPLTKEEELRVRAYFYVQMLMDSSKGFPIQVFNPMSVENTNWKWHNTTVSKENIDFNNKNPYTAESIKEIASATIDKFTESGTGAGTVTDTLINLDSLAKYYAASMYGINYEPTNLAGTVNESTSINSLPQSIFLESVGCSIDQPNDVIAYNYCNLGKMKNMLAVANTDSAYDSYLRLVYYEMLATTYAELYAGIDESGKYEALEEFIKLYDGKIDELVASQDENPDIAPMLQTIKIYLSIQRAFDFLGIDAFTDNLKYIVNLAPKLEQFDELTEMITQTIYDNSEPMSAFFDVKSNTLNDDYKIGVELSSTYIPLKTNMYELESVAMLDDVNWVQRFHYPYGFYRKALYIDKNINAAVNKYITDGDDKCETRVATLEDLFQAEKDIVLYVDTNFYNVDKLAELTDKVYTKLQNVEDAITDDELQENTGFLDSVGNYFDELGDRDIEAIVKTGGHDTYSRNVKYLVSNYLSTSKDRKEGLILTSDEIDKYISGYNEDPQSEVYDNYTPLQAFAVVSAIYRDSSLFQLTQSQCKKNSPVFISSAALAGINGVSKQDFNSIYNYAMLKNLESNLDLDVESTIDRNSPLYIDIYGNILTESGLVVIPALSNATLCSKDYSPTTVGFVTLYSNGDYKIPVSQKNAKKYINNMFYSSETSGCYEIGSKLVNNVYLNFDKLPASDKRALQAVKYIAQHNVDKAGYLPFSQRVYMITEVMRGAPINNIRKDFEGIGKVTVSKTGIFFAAKLDELTKSFLAGSNGNNIISLPNLAFAEGFEYVILFLFKIVFAASLALLVYRIYIDSVQGKLGMKSLFSFLISLMMFLIIAFSIPKLLDISYYQVNKLLLQDETEYIAMLDLEKKMEGREIGVLEVAPPETNTELYLRLDDLSVPWYEVINDVLFKSTFKTVKEIYDSKLNDSQLANLPGTIKRGNGLYMSISSIFATTDVEYDTECNILYTVTKETPHASYVTPYYVILDSLVSKINYYNMNNNIKDYNKKISSDGRVRVSGMISPCLTSKYFMETSQDLTGLKYVCGVDTHFKEGSPFEQDDIAKMIYSYWYRTEEDDKDLADKLSALDEDAKMFVVKNKELLGKVSDETFLKVMALSLATKYNNIVGVNAGNAIEIYNIDVRDILKLSVAKRSVVLKDSSKSYARFIYDNEGTIGVITSALLIAVYFVSTLVKPLIVFIILGSMVAAAVLRRTVKNDSYGAIEGLFITSAILVGINMLYALILKGSMSIPYMGANIVLSCIVQIILQITYMIVLIVLLHVVLSDWRDLGFNKYANVARVITSSVKTGSMRLQHAKVHSRNVSIKGDNIWEKDYRRNRRYESRSNRRNAYRDPLTYRESTGYEILQDMLERDEDRRRRR